MFINMRPFLAILWIFELLHFNYFLPNYKVGINHVPITNKINYLSENVLCSKIDKTVTDIREKPGTKIKIKR